MSFWSFTGDPRYNQGVRRMEEASELRDRTSKLETRMDGVERAQERTERNLAEFIAATNSAGRAMTVGGRIG